MTPLSGRVPSEIAVDVVIPVLNEAHVLARSIATLHQFLSNHLRYKWRIIIADNGSTDGTAAIGGRLAEERAEVSCFHLKQRGRGRALRYAWMQSSADIVCYMDVDLSTELEALPRAIHTVVAEGYDLVVGSRLMRSSRIHRSLQREIISRIYNLFVKALLFTRFSDAQCGFKAVTREVVERIVPQVKDQGWFFDTELLVLAERQGYRIKDIPVAWIEDTDSRVKILQTAWEDIKGVFRLRRLLWSKEFVQLAVLNGKRMHP